MISSRGVEIETIESWPEPESVHDVQAFIGFTGFYRRFIEGYSKICAQLTDQTKTKGKKPSKRKIRHRRRRRSNPRSQSQDNGDSNFLFTQETREAFQKLKQIYSTSTLLRHFNSELRI